MAVGAARRHQLAVEGETHHALDGLAVREVGLHRVRGFDVEQEAATSVGVLGNEGREGVLIVSH